MSQLGSEDIRSLTLRGSSHEDFILPRKAFDFEKEAGLTKYNTVFETRSIREKSDQKVPFLEEILELVSKYQNRTINIELRAPDIGSQIVETVNNYIKSGKLAKDQFLISSDNQEELKHIREQDKDIKTSLIIRSWRKIGNPSVEELGQKIQELGVSAVNPHQEAFNDKLLEVARTSHVPVYVWSTNELYPDQKLEEIAMKAEVFKQEGLDINIISDIPAHMTALRDGKGGPYPPRKPRRR